MTQRMGWILRPGPVGRSSRFVILHMIGTSEDPDLGAHAAFLDEVLPYADDVTAVPGRRFLDLGTGRP